MLGQRHLTRNPPRSIQVHLFKGCLHGLHDGSACNWYDVEPSVMIRPSLDPTLYMQKDAWFCVQCSTSHMNAGNDRFEEHTCI